MTRTLGLSAWVALVVAAINRRGSRQAMFLILTFMVTRRVSEE